MPTKTTLPPGLSPNARLLYRRIAHDFGVGDAEGVALLRLACESLTDYENHRATIAKDGATTTGRDGQPKAHPLIPAARDARAAAMAALKALRLDDGKTPQRGPGRPQGEYHWAGEK